MTTTSVRVCLYCSQPICADDRVAACEKCFTAHHEECWERNGRCSTFRCLGAPRTMRGADLPAVVQAALDGAANQPATCPFCANRVYAGVLQSAPVKGFASGPTPQDNVARTGLLFASRGKPNPHNDWFGKRFLSKMLGAKSWFLPGAHLKARSCGKCHRLFVWGMAADEGLISSAQAETDERYCPHCAVPLWPGHIVVGSQTQGGARFECDDTPDFHRDWFGHNILDRFFFNRWNPTVRQLPARSCPQCQFTEVAGRPIYRFS
jgi:hypothetical protein